MIFMSTFLKLFGIKTDDVKKTCVLLPLIKKEILGWFGVEDFSRGKLYGAGKAENFTLIHTGLGAGLLGDAVLYLKNTECRNIVAFGSCGLIEQNWGLDIGSLVVPERAFGWESFSDMLLEKKNGIGEFRADAGLTNNFLSANKACVKVNCATLGSIKLEEGYVDFFREKNVQIVDMECSALFSAARHAGKKAIALFYVNDIIHQKPFYEEMDSRDKTNLLSSVKSAPVLLCDFIKNSLS